ncbi:MAG: BrnT family toxin [Candidatus Korobacteraceae bacterium]
MRLTWDERKNRANQKKHRISFETAMLVFDDPGHISVQDREVEGEMRWQTIGMVKGLQVLLVAHTVSEFGSEEVVHIISARKATPLERSIYAQAN